jgi:hypothetical protein
MWVLFRDEKGNPLFSVSTEKKKATVQEMLDFLVLLLMAAG